MYNDLLINIQRYIMRGYLYSSKERKSIKPNEKILEANTFKPLFTLWVL